MLPLYFFFLTIASTFYLLNEQNNSQASSHLPSKLLRKVRTNGTLDITYCNSSSSCDYVNCTCRYFSDIKSSISCAALDCTIEIIMKMLLNMLLHKVYKATDKT